MGTAAPPVPGTSRPFARLLHEWPLPCVLVPMAALQAWLGAAVHTVTITGGESDLYVERAAGMLRGEWHADPYHPCGYPLAVYALGRLGLEPFTAAKLLSALAGLLFVAATYALLRAWVGRGPAALAAGAVAASRVVLTTSVQACSDVPAAALVTVAVALWVHARPGRRWRACVAGGAFLCGVAFAVRTPSAWFVAALLPVLLAVPWRQRLAGAVWAAVAFVAGAAPQFVWATVHLGSPFAGPAWHSIVLKYHHRGDEMAWVADLPRYTEIARAEWVSWLPDVAAEICRFLTAGLFAWWDVGGVAGVALSLVALAGLLRGAWSRDAGRRTAAVAGLVYAVLLAATFRPVDRLLLPLVPFAVLGALWLQQALVRTRVQWHLVATCAAFAVVSVWRLPAAIAHFRRLHPHAELAATERLLATYGPPLRALRRPFFRVDDANDPWRSVRRIAQVALTEFFVLDPGTSAAAVEALERAGVPDDFTILERRPLLIAMYTPPPRAWAEDAAAVADGDSVQLRIVVADRPELRDSLLCGFLVRPPDAEWLSLPLAATQPRTFELRVPRAAFAAGAHRLVPTLVTSRGTIVRAQPFETSFR